LQVHAHWGTYTGLKASRKANLDIMKGIGYLLGKKLDDDEAIAKATEFAGAG